MGRQQRIREGMFVRSADGKRLGRIALVGERDFQIEKGSFFPTEYVASFDEVKGIRDDEVILVHERKRFQRGDVADAAPPEPEVEAGSEEEGDALRHERQLAEVRHEQHERYRQRHGESWEWNPRIGGSGATTTSVVRETLVVEKERSDEADTYREANVGALSDDDKEVSRAWREHDVAVGKRRQREETRYTASENAPSGLRLERRKGRSHDDE
jgi:hypothetical protein